MKMRKMKTALAAITIIALVFTACSVKDGDQGPAGSAGATGAPGTPGANGRDGVDGTDGTDGNANVKSLTYTIRSTDWTNGNATISIPELTEDIANNGQVAVYFTLQPSTVDTLVWNPLPYRFVGTVGGTNQFITIQNTVSIGKVVLSARLNTNGGVNLSAATARVILIPSSSLVDGVDVNNYEELKMVYGIDEYDLN